MTKCCVIDCKNIGIHKFPNDPTLKKKWIAALRRKKFQPTRSSRLCRDHFDESDYQSISITTGLPSLHRFLKKNAVPSKFSWNQKTLTASSVARAERVARRNVQRNIFDQSSQPSTSQEPLPSTSHDENVSVTVDVEANSDISIINAYVGSEEICNNISIGIQTSTLLAIFSTDMMITDDESVHFYTGLESAEKFKLVFSTLMPMAENLEYRWSNVRSISIEDQFLLVLIKLRRAKPDFELAKMFGVSKTQASNIFVTWVNFISDLWSLLDIWPHRDLVITCLNNSSKTKCLQELL